MRCNVIKELLGRAGFFLRGSVFAAMSTMTACSSAGNPVQSLESLLKPESPTPAQRSARSIPSSDSAAPTTEVANEAPVRKESDKPPVKKADPYSVIDPF